MDIGLLQGIWTIIVLVTFVGIVVWAWSRKRKKDFDEASRIPFQGDEDSQNSKDD